MQTTILDWPYPTVKEDYESGDSQWREITEEAYDWFAEVLPPLRFDWSGHVCSEPYCHTAGGAGVYLGCIRRKDGDAWRYIARLLTLAEFDCEYANFKILFPNPSI